MVVEKSLNASECLHTSLAGVRSWVSWAVGQCRLHPVEKSCSSKTCISYVMDSVGFCHVSGILSFFRRDSLNIKGSGLSADWIFSSFAHNSLYQTPVLPLSHRSTVSQQYQHGQHCILYRHRGILHGANDSRVFVHIEHDFTAPSLGFWGLLTPYLSKLAKRIPVSSLIGHSCTFN